MDQNITLLKELAQNKSLLIVEDEDVLGEALERLLARFFKTVFTASTAKKAFTIYKREKKSSQILVLTDINLGAQSGIELTCKLKKIDPKQRVIAISGTEERTVFIDSIQCKIDGFLLKPLQNHLLIALLIEILKKMDYDVELEKSQKLLKESEAYALRLLANQDQFLKDAIHEIYTPLAIIITNIDLLRMHGIENESLNAIEAGSRIIQNSYEDMTYLMKHTRMPENKTSIDLVAFIMAHKNYFSCIAEVNELTISLVVGQSNLPFIEFSELKLTRLVDNTLSNAIKYATRPSDINIIIGMENENLFFEIRNHGPVIQDKKKIFERFYRESKHKGGYGLGLGIVAQICEEENVTIKIGSSQLRGTSFRYIFNSSTTISNTKESKER